MTHVLIVDDIEENRYLLRSLLEGNGYRVTMAGDGLEALAAARREPPNIIVSDALMPKMDGFTLCRAWMQEDRFRAIPFVFYSATYTSPEDEKLALALGAVRYLIKPLESEVFLRELTRVLREWAGRPASGPAAPLDEPTFRALYTSALSRKVESKLAQLQAMNSRLRQSEHNYRQLFEDNPQPMMVYDLETLRYLAVNDAAVAHYGYSRDEFLAMTLVEIRSAEEIPRMIESVAAVVREGTAESGIWRHHKKDGTPIDVEISTHIIDFGGRRANMVLGQDVTERLRMEEILQQTARRLSLATESALIGIWDLDLEKNELIWDKRMCELYAIRPGDFGDAYEAWEQGVHPDDLVAARAEVNEAIAGAEGLHTHFRVVWPNGQIHHIEAHAIVQSGPDGTPQRMIGVNWDITERKRAEETLQESESKFRSLSEDSIAGVVIIREGRFSYVNPAMTRIMGYSREEMLAAPSILEFVVEEDRSLVSENVRLRLQGELEQISYSFGVRSKDGSLIRLEVQGSRISSEDGIATMATVLDITERKRAEDALRRQTEELRARNEELTRFNRATAGRELRMIELKQEVNDLEAQLGRSRPYALAFMDAAGAKIVASTPKPAETPSSSEPSQTLSKKDPSP